MSAVEEYRNARSSRRWRPYWLAKADAALAELEAHLDQARDAAEHQRDMREQAEAALAERTRQRDEANTAAINQRRDFEKALAKRDRMLDQAERMRRAIDPLLPKEKYMDKLRARAEEGNKDE